MRRAALDGWFWGFGFFVAGLWWLGAAFLVEADAFAWAMPLGVLGLPALLALFPAFGFALARLLWTPGAARILALAAGLTVSEWLRGHLFTGFPWNALGMALGVHLWPMQAASVVGLWGLTLLAVAIGAAPATLADREGRRFAPSLAAGALLSALAAGGALRLPAGPTPAVDGVRLRIMQPNLPQDAKFRPRERGRRSCERYLADQPAREGPGGEAPDYTHLIWPESAFPFLLERAPLALAQIADLLPAGTVLVTGAARMEEPLPGETVGRFFNAIQAVGDDGTVRRRTTRPISCPSANICRGARRPDPGARPAAIRAHAGGLRAGGEGSRARRSRPAAVRRSICYEAIFSGALVPARASARA